MSYKPFVVIIHLWQLQSSKNIATPGLCRGFICLIVTFYNVVSCIPHWMTLFIRFKSERILHLKYFVSVQDQWLVDASVNLNPKLRLSPRNQVIALYAITRLDISNNALTELPDMIFQLPSLKVSGEVVVYLHLHCIVWDSDMLIRATDKHKINATLTKENQNNFMV